jgi:cytoskeletal protein CcmA (bactofilin family)
MFGRKTEIPAAGQPAQESLPGGSGPAPRATAPRPAAQDSSKPAAAPGDGAPHAARTSVIGEGFDFKGDMSSEGSLTVNGAIRGNLVLKSLLVGATGLVDGSVQAESVSVEGSLLGSVKCSDLVVGERAIVDGKLNYATIAIHRGATIKGELKRA